MRATALGLVLVFSGCDFVELRSICATAPAQQFPGISVPIHAELALTMPEGIEGELTVTSIRFLRLEGAPDFSFVTMVKVSIAQAGELVAAGAASPELQLTGELAPVDAASQIALGIELDAQMPADGITTDVELCAAGQLRFGK